MYHITELLLNGTLYTVNQTNPYNDAHVRIEVQVDSLILWYWVLFIDYNITVRAAFSLSGIKYSAMQPSTNSLSFRGT